MEKKSAYYFVGIRERSTGDHPVHKEGCPLMPDSHKIICLGKYESPQDARDEGKKIFNRVAICSFCCRKFSIQSDSVNAFQMTLQENLLTSDQLMAIRENVLQCPLN